MAAPSVTGTAVTGSAIGSSANLSASVTIGAGANGLAVRYGFGRLGNTITAVSVVLDPGGGDEATFTLGVEVSLDVTADVTVGIAYLPPSLMPAAGTYAVEVDPSAFFDTGWMEVQPLADAPEIDASDPLDAPRGTNTENDTNNEPIDVSLTTLVDNSLVLQVAASSEGSSDKAMSPADGQTEVSEAYVDGSTDLNIATGHSTKATAGALTEGWQIGASRLSCVIAALALPEVGGGGGSSIAVLRRRRMNL